MDVQVDLSLIGATFSAAVGTLPRPLREAPPWGSRGERGVRWRKNRTPKFAASEFLVLCWLEGGHFHLAVTFAGVVHHAFEAFRHVIGDPVRAALGADQRGDVPHNDHTETQVNGKGGGAWSFLSTAIRAGFGIQGIHGFLSST